MPFVLSTCRNADEPNGPMVMDLRNDAYKFFLVLNRSDYIVTISTLKLPKTFDEMQILARKALPKMKLSSKDGSCEHHEKKFNSMDEINTFFNNL